MFDELSIELFISRLQIVKPCGRINSCMVVGKDMLYLYGGMMEIKDQEITLDDMYALNLSKLDEWKCIIPVGVYLAHAIYLRFWVLFCVRGYCT